jgi:hypothetical protein
MGDNRDLKGCGRCVYFRSAGSPWVGKPVEDGWCVVRAPVAIAGQLVGAWPMVTVLDWCGEIVTVDGQ